MKHLDKVKLYRVGHCFWCGQHFVIDEEAIAFQIDLQRTDAVYDFIDTAFFECNCPACDERVRVTYPEYEKLPCVIKEVIQ